MTFNGWFLRFSINRQADLVDSRHGLRPAGIVVLGVFVRARAAGTAPGEVPDEAVHSRSFLEDFRLGEPTLGDGQRLVLPGVLTVWTNDLLKTTL